MSERNDRPGRHARGGTFVRDVAIAGVLFVVAAFGAYALLTAMSNSGDGPVGADSESNQSDGDTEVAGITVTVPEATPSDDSTDAPSETTTSAPTPTTEAQSDPTQPPPPTETTLPPDVVSTVPDPSEIRVQILNGIGTAGLAARVSQALADSGYQMLAPDDTESLDQTQILFREPFGPAAFELADRFPDAEVGLGNDLASGVDIVVMLGATYREE